MAGSEQSAQVGVNWAIDCGSPRIEYIEGRRAATAKEAEAEWRRVRGLHFLSIDVRRTTPEEDQRLEEGKRMVAANPDLRPQPIMKRLRENAFR